MFVYLLIAFELALVYLVIWYLYLRNPKHVKRKIKGAQWGRYSNSNSPYTADGGKYYPTIGNQTCECGRPQESIPSFVTYQSEFVLNERTNRYVRDEHRQVKSLLSNMSKSIDSTLGRLSTRER